MANILDDDMLDVQINNKCSFTNIKKAADFFVNNENKFSVLNLNIRSLKKNYDSLLIYLRQIKTNFDVIVLTETWLNDNESDLYLIPGYCFSAINRLNKRGGGIRIYYKECYKCNFLTSSVSLTIEYLFISLSGKI